MKHLDILYSCLIFLHKSYFKEYFISFKKVELYKCLIIKLKTLSVQQFLEIEAEENIFSKIHLRILKTVFNLTCFIMKNYFSITKNSMSVIMYLNYIKTRIMVTL